MLSLAGVHSIKRIEVAIKPFELEAVKESLSELGVGAMTVSEVHQLASSTTAPRVYRGSAYVADFAVMLRIEVVAPADRVRSILEAIRRSAKSTCTGDALGLVTDIGEVVRLESGESESAVVRPPAHRAPAETRPTWRARSIAWQT